MTRLATTVLVLVALGCGGGQRASDQDAWDVAEQGADVSPGDPLESDPRDGKEAPGDAHSTTDPADGSLDAAPEDAGDDGTAGTDAVGECPVTVSPAAGLVVTDRGAVQGWREDDAWAFLGIPYAAPPVGPLRWRSPEPHVCWEGVRDATAWPPACMQIDPKTDKTVGSEDCLVVNVWTPTDRAPDQPLPVLFFVHGGGNIQGSSAETATWGMRIYDGAYLASHAKVVVVTVNYRLGALGYLALPELAFESSHQVSGNYGILDLVRALTWVRDNIAAFGGDPGHVLLFGESAGAINTCVLFASPLAKGLFHAALMQSGGCNLPSSVRAIADGEQFVGKTPCAGAADRLACLRNLTPESVILALPGHTKLGNVNFGPDPSVTYGPHVDGYVLPDAPLDLIVEGRHNRVPFVIGSNADEVEAALSVQVSSAAEYEAAVAAAFAYYGNATVQAILHAYPISDFESPQKALVALVTDLKFTCPTRVIARTVRQGQTEAVFRYFFARRPDTPRDNVGAIHGIELAYLFHTLTEVPLYTPSEADLDLAEAIIGYWTRFAATGDPNGADAPRWPEYDAQIDSHLILDAPPEADEGVRTGRCDFWDALLRGTLPPAEAVAPSP